MTIKFKVTYKYGQYILNIEEECSTTQHVLGPEELLNLVSESAFYTEKAKYEVEQMNHRC